MKTYILQLEGHDDIISARDKMNWAKGGRILLVWPERGTTLQRRLDLTLLQRHSAQLGAQLAIVANQPEVCYQALHLGIPVFHSLEKAQKSPWRTPRRYRQSYINQTITNRAPAETTPHRQPTRPDRSISSLNLPARLALFALGVLAFLAIAATLLPSAQVTITPLTTTQEVEVVVQASPETRSVNLSGAIPARWEHVTVEGRDTEPVHGSVLLPDRPATGNVTFTNLTDQKVDIPANTVVRTMGADAKRFVVIQDGTVQASTSGTGTGSASTISLPIRSLTLGSTGNLPAGDLRVIEGSLGVTLSVNNPMPTQDGKDRREPAPIDQDRQRLATRLAGSLDQTALQELQARLPAGDLFVPASVERVQILEQAFQPAEKEPTDLLELNLRVEYQGLAISEADLHILAKDILEASLQAGFTPLEDTLEIRHLSEPTLQADGSVQWKMHASRRLEAQLSTAQAIQLALGLPPDAARERMADELPLASAPQVQITPDWWPRLPFLPFRIQVIIQ